MSQIEFAVTLSRRLESVLEQKYKATGKGLHEKISSVEDKLPAQLVKSMRYIATMRNSVVHQHGFVIDDFAGFSAQGDAALAQLGAPLNANQEKEWFSDLMSIAYLMVIGGCAVAGAFFCFRSSGSVGGAVGGFIGGTCLGAWLLSILKTVAEIVLGLFLIGCAIAVLVSILQWAGYM